VVEKLANSYKLAYHTTEGNSGAILGAAPTEKKTHPVTEVTWRDSVVWCNAYSEVTGKTPVYYVDAACTVVLRLSDVGNVLSNDSRVEKAYIKADADGFRLPTEAEWEYAARGGVPSTGTPWTYTYAGSNNIDDVAWYITNAGGWLVGGSSNSAYGTHAVKTKQPNSLGLYDMSGNVSEWCWDWGEPSKPNTGYNGGKVLRGGEWRAMAEDVASRYGESITDHSGMDFVGFRVVCR
jgi:formylglycine-generating enzyme required for sulfatase activity